MSCCGRLFTRETRLDRNGFPGGQGRRDVALGLLGPVTMGDTTRRRRLLFIPMWLLVSIIVLAAGLYFGYRWPEITGTIVLLSLVAIWVGTERLTTRRWY